MGLTSQPYRQGLPSIPCGSPRSAISPSTLVVWLRVGRGQKETIIQLIFVCLMYCVVHVRVLSLREKKLLSSTSGSGSELLARLKHSPVQYMRRSSLRQPQHIREVEGGAQNTATHPEKISQTPPHTTLQNKNLGI